MLQPVQGFPDQLRLGSERGINDHHQFLTVDQEVLEDSIRFLSMEGVGVEEVEPDKFFRRVECLTREKTCLNKSILQAFEFSHQEETLIEMYLQSWIKVQKQRSGCCRKNLKDRGTPNTEYISEAKP